jgi:hypothetical protein
MPAIQAPWKNRIVAVKVHLCMWFKMLYRQINRIDNHLEFKGVRQLPQKFRFTATLIPAAIASKA